jgi:hypothetical protein
MNTALTGLSRGRAPMNTPGDRCHPLPSHSRSGPKEPASQTVSLSDFDYPKIARRVTKNDVN